MFAAYFQKMSGGETLPPRPPLKGALMCGIGGFLAIVVVTILGASLELSLIMAPFGASCFLAFALPKSPLAQPRSIVFGHVFSTISGLVVLSLLGPVWYAPALGVGLAIIVMLMTRTSHAPAGADPLVVFALEPTWAYVVFPVFTGAFIISVVALIYNNLRPNIKYPQYW